MSTKETSKTGQELRQKLDERGGHLTRQRVAVFDYMKRADHHPTAEDVFLSVKRKLPKISLATVYKNLEALVECGAISKLTYGDASARYDIRTDQHYHTRCLSCGRIGDLDPEKGVEPLEQIRPKEDFEIISYRLELVGYCRNCRK